MHTKSFITNLLLFFCFGLATQNSYGWGAKGHHHICEAATFLVTAPELRNFLKSRGAVMGHLCNIPDTYWKSLTGEARSLGDPTHYIDPEILGLPLEKIPLDFKKLEKSFRGQINQFDTSKKISSVAKEVGSVWWRMDQFLRLATEQFTLAAKATAPQNPRDEQNSESPFNKAVYLGHVYLGLMGHYIGDAIQPFHVTTDFDGYKAGHGGIHSYYEEQIVNELPPDWTGQVVKEALDLREALLKSKSTNKNFLTEKKPLKAFQLLTVLSYQDIQAILKLDPLITPSKESLEKGMSLRTPATRKPASDQVKYFEPLVRLHMARGALFLAHMWETAYSNSNKKAWPISKYKSYRYPFTPAFVKPDYLDLNP